MALDSSGGLWAFGKNENGRLGSGNGVWWQAEPIKVLDNVMTPSGRPVRVIQDGRIMAFDVPAQIVNGRMLVPLRAIFEELGALVQWDASTKTVTARSGEVTVSLTIGDTSPTVNGQVVAIEQPAIIVDGRTLVPLRFVAEAFGVDVGWDQQARTVYISSISAEG